MPRSSGGGSHSSGSHHSSGSSRSYSSGGGSHHGGSSYSSSRSYSSSSYSSSGYSSGYSSSSRSSSGYSSGRYSAPVTRYVPPRVSREYFSGAKTYVRYAGATPHYLYANIAPSSYEGGFFAGLLRLILNVFGWLNVAMLVLLVGAFIYAFVGGPGPLNENYNKEIIIADGAGVMKSTEELEKSMYFFFKTTGICPSVMTVNNEDWEPYYDSLENYAFDLYVNSFDDECHWLWVYSQPREPSQEFNDWYFEGIQGDRTGTIITSSLADKTVDTLQRGFTKKAVSVEQAFADAFDTATDEAEKLLTAEQFEPIYLLIVLPFALLAVIPFVLLKLFNSHISKKYSNYRLANGSSEKKQQTGYAAETAAVPSASVKKQRSCEYCGSIYTVGEITSCPGCGAPVSAE